MISTRRAYYEPRLPAVDQEFREADSRRRVRLEQHRLLEERMQGMLVAPRPEFLATNDERRVIARLDDLAARIDAQQDGSDDALRERLARLRGVVIWSLKTEYHERLTRFYENLEESRKAIDVLEQEYAAFVRTRQAATHSYVGYETPIRQAQAIASWALPEFFENESARYATDLEALKRDGETVPASQLLVWQNVEDQIEAGLQRPWTKNKPGKHGGALEYVGPGLGTTFAHTEIYAEKDVELWVALGATDYGRVWVNDRLVAAAVDGPDEEERIAWGVAAFRKGRNTVVVRLDNARRWTGSGAKRRMELGGLDSHFWVKVAVQGRPLDAAAAQARRSAIAAKEATMRHFPANVQAYRNHNVACYPDARPVT